MRIKRYLQGHRSGKEANRIERQAMDDPFLAEALEGYEGTKDNPERQISRMRRNIRSHNQQRLNVFQYGGLAASVVFILVFGIYFGLHRSSPSLPVDGFPAYHTYVEANKERPAEACQDVTGKVELSFHIDPAGKAYDIQVKTPLCPALDAEAVRLLREGPLWTPTEKQMSYTIVFE